MIDYRLRLRGLPLCWRTRINAREPPHRFVDDQLRDPFRTWMHEHTFEARDGGTLARDRVPYPVRLDWLAHRSLVRAYIGRNLWYRSAALKRLFASAPGNRG